MSRRDGCAAHLADHPDIGLLAAGSTLAARARFEHRAMFLAADRDEAVQALRAMAEGAPVPNVTRGSVSPQVLDGGLAVLFTGQGGQRPGMGGDCTPPIPVFACALDEVCARMDVHARTAAAGGDVRARGHRRGRAAE